MGTLSFFVNAIILILLLTKSLYGILILLCFRWVLWNSWNPFCKTVQVPSMSDVSDMLIWINSEQHRKSVRIVSDLHLTPPVQDVGTLEYDKFDEIVDTSYRYAQPLIADWVEANPWLISTPKISE